MLSAHAFNALLKTLEEPPPHVVFIFATTEAHKIPTTILSRCQRYDFKLIPTARLTEHLTSILRAEKIDADAGGGAPDRAPGGRLGARRAVAARPGDRLRRRPSAHRARSSPRCWASPTGAAGRAGRRGRWTATPARRCGCRARGRRGRRPGSARARVPGLPARPGGIVGERVAGTSRRSGRRDARRARGGARAGAQGARAAGLVGVLFDRWARAVDESSAVAGAAPAVEMAAVDLCAAEPLSRSAICWSVSRSWRAGCGVAPAARRRPANRRRPPRRRRARPRRRRRHAGRAGPRPPPAVRHAVSAARPSAPRRSLAPTPVAAVAAAPAPARPAAAPPASPPLRRPATGRRRGLAAHAGRLRGEEPPARGAAGARRSGARVRRRMKLVFRTAPTPTRREGARRDRAGGRGRAWHVAPTKVTVTTPRPPPPAARALRGRRETDAGPPTARTARPRPASTP